MTRFLGVTKNLGGADFVVPPLSLGQLKRLQPLLRSMGEADPEAQIDLMSQVIFSSLSRNYPAITQDEVDDLIDVGNVADIFAVVVSVSALEPKKTEVM